MNFVELESSPRSLVPGGMAAGLETRPRQAQVEVMLPMDLISVLVSDEPTRRGDRLLERRQKQAGFGDAQKNTRRPVSRNVRSVAVDFSPSPVG